MHTNSKYQYHPKLMRADPTTNKIAGVSFFSHAVPPQEVLDCQAIRDHLEQGLLALVGLL